MSKTYTLEDVTKLVAKNKRDTAYYITLDHKDGTQETVYKLKGTSKNYPFAIWAHLLPQLFAAKIPQYTKYSGISATQFGTKSAAQIIKK